MSRVREYAWKGWPDSIDGPSLQPYYSRRCELSVEDGCLLWGSRLIVPPQAQQPVITELHTAHPGITRMKSLARSYVWWPGMDQDLERKVRSCQVCQENRKSPASAPLHPWEYPSKPWSRLHVDYAGPFMGKMILVIVDAHSKWIDCHIGTAATSEATTERLRATFATHGLPDMVVSDNATCFSSGHFKEFCEGNGIVHVTSAPYHAASNGLAERAVQTVKDVLKKVSEESLQTKMSRFLFNYRITPQTTTGLSPAELLMKRKLKTRLDLLHPDLQGKVQKKQMKMKENHDVQAKSHSFQVGQPVFAKNFSAGSKWIPAIISETTGPVSYKVTLQDGQLVRRHVDQVRIRYADPSPDVTTNLPESISTTPAAIEPSPQLTNPSADATAQPQLPKETPAEIPLKKSPTEDLSKRVVTRSVARNINTNLSEQTKSHPARERKTPSWMKDYAT